VRKPSSSSRDLSVLTASSVLAMTLALLGLSCYRYHAISIEHRSDAARLFTPDAGRKEINDPVGAEGSRVIRIDKYFAVTRSTSPAAVINRKGVEHALQGRFNEARNLFLEALREDPEMAAAYNNLGIVYEVFGRRDESSVMYSRACRIEPDNERFQKNFLYVNGGVRQAEGDK